MKCLLNFLDILVIQKRITGISLFIFPLQSILFTRTPLYYEQFIGCQYCTDLFCTVLLVPKIPKVTQFPPPYKYRHFFFVPLGIVIETFDCITQDGYMRSCICLKCFGLYLKTGIGRTCIQVWEQGETGLGAVF